MANRYSYHKRYTGNQTTCKPTDTGTDQTHRRCLLHVISILNVTRYAVQVNRQKLNEMIDALQRS